MIIILLLIAIVILILGIYIANRCSREWCDLGLAMEIAGGLATGIGLIITLALAIAVSNLATVDERLAMYEEENAKIESQIVDAIENYQKYETDIFTEVSPESAITLVAMYPELKSDTLVQKQIEVYMANNDKIKALKEEKIDGSVMRWWLYFGGRR